MMSMEKVSMSNDSSCGDHPQDNITALMTSTSLNNESLISLSDGETSVDSSDLNAQLVSGTQISGYCDSIPGQPKYNTDCSKSDTDSTAAVDYNKRSAEDADDCKDYNDCFDLLQGQNPVENDLLHADSDDVDVSKLASALCPKRTFVMNVGADYSFAALTADHEDYCKQNLENVTRQKSFISSSGETYTSSMQGILEAEWPTVSRWLNQSKQQFSKQFPHCSALVHGLPASHQKLHINRVTSSQKLTVCTDKRQTLDSAAYSSEVKNEPVPSLNSQITSISNYANDDGLGAKSDDSNRLLSTALLSREKILSLQFSGIPLSPQVISRIRELKLKRTDAVLRPMDSKCSSRNTPSHKQPVSSFNSITVLQSISAPTEVPATSASTKHTYVVEPVKQSAIKLDAVSTAGTDTTIRSHTLPYPSDTSVEFRTQAPDNYESDIRTSVVAGGETCSHSALQSMTARSDAGPIMSHLSPVSDTSADTAVTYITSNKEKFPHQICSIVETTHDGPMKTSNTNTFASTTYGEIASADITATTYQNTIQSITKCQLSAQASLLSVSERPAAKKCNTEASEILTVHSDDKDSDLSPVQLHTLRSADSVTNRNPHQRTHGRFMEERRRKVRQSSSYAEASIHSPVAGVSDSKTRSKSQRAKCSRCQNVDPSSNNAYAYQFQASRHQTPHDMFDYYNAYKSYYMPNMSPSVLASVSYSSYCLGAYDAHVCNMHYYNMLRHQATITKWQHQADYIRRLAKFYAHY